MDNIFNIANISLAEKTDILVVGAGSAGCMAALAASEESKDLYSVMLVERYGFPGGTSTQMLDTFYGFFTPGKQPVKIVGGWPDEVVNALDRENAIFLRPNTYGAGTGVTYNPERLKNIWDQLLVKYGVKFLLHTTLIGVEPGIEGYYCIFWNKGGIYKVFARRVIDASGDADFSHLAGFKYEIAGDNEPAQSMTTTFRMTNVNLQTYYDHGGKSMLTEKMSIAVDRGQYPLPRKKGSVHEMTAKNCIATVAVKVAGYSGLNAPDLTQAEIEGREQTYIYEEFLKKEIPGFEDSSVIGMSSQIGVRETRRIYGMHRLTKEECLKAVVPDDSIFLCGAPIEDHRLDPAGRSETHWEYIPDDGIYGVPYGTIVPEASDLSWCVGRCFSATHDAHASCRSMAQTMSMGQASGMAAVESLRKDVAAKDIDVSSLQDQLMYKGAIFDKPSTPADISRSGWKNNLADNKIL